MTNEELIQYGINWDKALESRGDEPMSEARQFLVSAIQALESQRWIPCKEKLADKEVLCCDIHGEYLVGYVFEHTDSVETGFAAESDETFMYDCIAWMPLPQPYKEGEADDE